MSERPTASTPATTGGVAANEADRAHETPLAGCCSRPLLNYLKAVGLLSVVARQADPGVHARWVNGRLVLRSSLNRNALEEFLLARYAPAPVVSPWNGGSGFFPKDNKKAFEAIESSTDERIAAFQNAIEVSRAALRVLGITEKPSGDEATKVGLVRHLRARLDDDALEWLDASIVLLGSKRAFPPLLGSGGNDGRYDFANNYAQAVVAALALDDGERSRELARRQLAGALYANAVELRAMSAAYLLRDQSPVNSPSGESDGLGNPWDLVLAIEGSCLLAAGAARRHQAAAGGSLVAPFTAHATAAGYGSAVAGEHGRDELWLPLWSRWTSLPELRALIREGRAQVGRRQARSGLDFVRSCGALGIARGIDAFERYALLERAGQSTLAVPAGAIAVRERPHARAIHTIDSWLTSVHSYMRGGCPRAHREAVARLERRLFAFADGDRPAAACSVLEAIGALESLLAGARAGTDRQPGLAPLSGADLEPWLLASDDETHEFAVAASLASLHDSSPSMLPRLRDYLHGTGLDEHGRSTYAPGISPAVSRRADPIVRLAQLHVRRHIDAARTPIHDRRQHDHADENERVRQLTFTYGIACPLVSARMFATRALDDRRIVKIAAGLAVLRPRWPKQADGRLWRPKVGDAHGAPVPAFDLLALAFAGTHRARPEASDGTESSLAPALAERGVPLQPRPGWVAQLAAGRREAVFGDALLRLRLVGLTPLVDEGDLLMSAPSGPRLAAALLLHLPGRDRDRIAAALTTAVMPKQTLHPATDSQEARR